MNVPVIGYPYLEFADLEHLPSRFIIGDHLHGFDQHHNNELFVKLNEYAHRNNKHYTIVIDQLYDHDLTDRYKQLSFEYSIESFKKYSSWTKFVDYHVHPGLNYQHFVCSFNGSGHVSRQLLTAILHRFGWFNGESCSKNFAFTAESLDGHLLDYLPAHDKFYRKFFSSDQDFFEKIYSFGYVPYKHAQNIYNLESKLTTSFLHVVSETLATSYIPFITEKFLYSVVTRGLFLAWAQPGWHKSLEKHYGFKLYTKLFDYRFDSIANPVERLVELITMISKFSILSADELKDLYLIEQDTIEYNYDHYFSQDYLKCLARCATQKNCD